MKISTTFLALSYAAGMVSSIPFNGPATSIETRGACKGPIQPQEAQRFIDRNIAMWKREKGWQKLAKDLYNKDFKLYSNSIASSTGGEASYKSRQEFVGELEQRIPSTEKQSTVGFWIDCHELIWLRKIGKVAGKTDFVTQDMSVFSMQRTKAGTLQVKSALVEYDSIPWGTALGGKYTPPPDDGPDDHGYD